MSLARSRAEERTDHRIGHVEAVAEERDSDRGREAVASVVQLEPEEHVREAGDERRPEAHEVPHGPAPVERDDARVARRVVVLDRLVEGGALEREILTQVVDVVRDLLPRVRSFRARAHRLPPSDNPGSGRLYEAAGAGSTRRDFNSSPNFARAMYW